MRVSLHSDIRLERVADISRQPLQSLENDRVATYVCSVLYRWLCPTRIRRFQLSILHHQSQHFHRQPGDDLYLPVNTTCISLVMLALLTPGIQTTTRTRELSCFGSHPLLCALLRSIPTQSYHVALRRPRCCCRSTQWPRSCLHLEPLLNPEHSRAGQ